jgi:hypothetical protein
MFGVFPPFLQFLYPRWGRGQIPGSPYPVTACATNEWCLENLRLEGIPGGHNVTQQVDGTCCAARVIITI